MGIKWTFVGQLKPCSLSKHMLGSNTCYL